VSESVWEAEALRVVQQSDGKVALEWRRWPVPFPTRKQAEEVADHMAFALDTQARVVEIRPVSERSVTSEGTL
jgi:hypothetical protein